MLVNIKKILLVLSIFLSLYVFSEKDPEYTYKVEGDDLLITNTLTSKTHIFENYRSHPGLTIRLPLEVPSDEKLPLEALIKEAKTSYKSGRLIQTLDFLRRAKKIKNNSYLVNKMLGSVYLELNLKEKGLKFYKESLRNKSNQEDLKIEIRRLEKKEKEKEKIKEKTKGKRK